MSSLRWIVNSLIIIYLMITQDIGKRKQMFRKYVRNIWRNLLTNICSTCIIDDVENKCSRKTVLKNRWRGTRWIQRESIEKAEEVIIRLQQGKQPKKKKCTCKEAICWYFFFVYDSWTQCILWERSCECT